MRTVDRALVSELGICGFSVGLPLFNLTFIELLGMLIFEDDD